MGQIISWFINLFGSMRSDLPVGPATLRRFRTGPGDRNPLMVQFFHWDAKGHGQKSWWKIFEDAVPDLEAIGCTQVWLPPPNKAMVPEGRGYDAYDLWDLGEFQQKNSVSTRWGSKEEFLSAIRAAKSRGIEVIIDAVLNHKLGGDAKEVVQAVEVDEMDRNKEIGPKKDMEAWTKYTFDGRDGKYSRLTWNSDHFTGIDWDARRKKRGIYKITGPGQHQGWSQRVDKEFGNYDYLLGVDIDHRHPDVEADLKAWGSWVIENTGATGGFRLDAIKHMDSQFLVDWLRYTRDTLNRSDLFAVGEYWTSNAIILRRRMVQFEGELSFFDVPLHDTFHIASKLGPSFDLRKVFKNSLLRFCPDDAVTFVDNHDTVIGQTLESWVGAKFKPIAYALILLRPEGYPCAFYSDLYEPETPQIGTVLRKLLLVRKCIAYGPAKTCHFRRNCVAWTREGDAEHPGGCFVIANNGSKDCPVHVRLGERKLYVNVIRPEERVTTSHCGEGNFVSKASTVAVWVPVENVHLTGINVK